MLSIHTIFGEDTIEAVKRIGEKLSPHLAALYEYNNPPIIYQRGGGLSSVPTGIRTRVEGLLREAPQASGMSTTPSGQQPS